MKRFRVEKAKVRREREYDAHPLDPRDPDILRMKQLMYARQGRPAGSHRLCIPITDRLRHRNQRRPGKPFRLIHPWE